MSNQNASNIITVLKDFKSLVELRKFAEAQHTTILDLNKKLYKLEQENEQLKKLVVEKHEDKVIRIEITPEEEIITQQISVLRNVSEQRPLTFEETRKLDLLIKNLKLVKKEATTIIGDAERINEKIPDAKLLEIAAIKKDESDTTG